MLKNILNLEGAQQLSKNEQKTINGGITRECLDFLSSGECRLKGSGCDPTFPNLSSFPGCGPICCM